MTTESSLQKDTHITLGSRPDTRLFRNQVGNGWVGNAMRLANGDVLIKGARYITFGLAPHSPDLIGLRTVTITPEMVGTQIAVFSAIEMKTAKGRVDPGQRDFVDMLIGRGAYAGIARSVDDAIRILRI